MKIKQITAASLCVHMGLAIPHDHQRFHGHAHKRSVATAYSTVVDVVTVTDYSAVVWVDNSGNIVTTEHKTPPTSTIASTSSKAVVVTTTSKSLITPVSAPTLFSSSSSTAVTSSISIQQESKYAPDTLPSVGSSSTQAASAPLPSSSAIEKSTSNSNAAAVFPGFGVAYDAWAGTACRPGLDGEFAFLASQGAHTLRVYDVCFTESVNSAATHGLRLMLGVTKFSNFDHDLGTLVSQVTATGPSWSVVDTVFIGNELVNDKLATSAEVAAKVTYARGVLKTAGFNGAVVTVDTWTAVRDDPVICSTSDFCAVNAHAYFDQNTLPQDAGGFVRMAIASVQKNNRGKTIVVTETGWPHAGATLGIAVPSVENQRAAMASIVEEFVGAGANNVFLFMAYDAHYKTGPEIERNFGIFDLDHYNGTP